MAGTPKPRDTASLSGLRFIPTDAAMARARSTAAQHSPCVSPDEQRAESGRDVCRTACRDDWKQHSHWVSGARNAGGQESFSEITRWVCWGGKGQETAAGRRAHRKKGQNGM